MAHEVKERGSRRVDDPTTMVIFGASGDLTRRKLIPAVFRLHEQGFLGDEFRILGYGRTDLSDEEFREKVLPGDDRRRHDDFAGNLHYQQGSYDDPDDFQRLRARLEDLAGDGQANYMFYMATPPGVFADVAETLSEAGIARRGHDEPWSRIILEKPFGHDLQSAIDLNARLKAVFDEQQIFRIDHYLGKETVQNLLVLRFANSIFEPIWNQKYVDHVQVTVGEDLGMEGRGDYYDEHGALRDMVQNHMMHLLSLVAMEPPVSLQADAIRDEKLHVLQALRPIPKECAANGVLQAQYDEGTVDGEHVPGYRQEEGVDDRSTTPTFIALKAFVDNWRWSGVPFYMRTGKRLATRVTEISIHFRAVPQVLFNVSPTGPMRPNVLAIRIQPDEGIRLQFQVKVPGPAMQIEPWMMDFTYAGAFDREPPEAYERLLLDAALGDSTLFTRSDEVEAAWRFVTPVIEGCRQQDPDQMATYEPGSWGPDEADELIRADGNEWWIH